MTPPKEEILRRLAERTIIVGDCWLWQGTTSNGHGQMKINGKHIYTHRLSAHVHWGFDLDSPMQILHKVMCFNTNCINPEHLYEGTAANNTRDAIICSTHVTVQARARTHCPQGHEFTEENIYLHPNGARACKACRRERSRAYNERVAGR